MIFHLIRHGMKDDGARVLTGRTSAVGLSTAGRAQAEWVAAQLADAGITCIFSSPQKRARETAVPLAARVGIGVETSAAFDEMDFGRWTGRDFADLTGLPDFMRFNRLRSLTCVPGGETMLEVRARVVGALLRWRDLLPGGAVAVFSHAEAIRAALIHFTGGSCDDWWRWEVEPGSISTIDVGHENFRIIRINACAQP